VTTFPPIVLTDPVALEQVLQRASQQLIGRYVDGAHVSAFVAQYHALETDRQQRKARGETYYTTTPGPQAERFIRTQFPDEVTAYRAGQLLQSLPKILGGPCSGC